MELLVVIAIIAILAALLLPALLSARAAARAAACQSNSKMVSNGFHLFAGENNGYLPGAGNVAGVRAGPIHFMDTMVFGRNHYAMNPGGTGGGANNRTQIGRNPLVAGNAGGPRLELFCPELLNKPVSDPLGQTYAAGLGGWGYIPAQYYGVNGHPWPLTPGQVFNPGTSVIISSSTSGVEAEWNAGNRFILDSRFPIAWWAAYNNIAPAGQPPVYEYTPPQEYVRYATGSPLAQWRRPSEKYLFVECGNTEGKNVGFTDPGEPTAFLNWHRGYAMDWTAEGNGRGSPGYAWRHPGDTQMAITAAGGVKIATILDLYPVRRLYPDSTDF